MHSIQARGCCNIDYIPGFPSEGSPSVDLSLTFTLEIEGDTEIHGVRDWEKKERSFQISYLGI